MLCCCGCYLAECTRGNLHSDEVISNGESYWWCWNKKKPQEHSWEEIVSGSQERLASDWGNVVFFIVTRRYDDEVKKFLCWFVRDWGNFIGSIFLREGSIYSVYQFKCYCHSEISSQTNPEITVSQISKNVMAQSRWHIKLMITIIMEEWGKPMENVWGVRFCLSSAEMSEHFLVYKLYARDPQSFIVQSIL